MRPTLATLAALALAGCPDGRWANGDVPDVLDADPCDDPVRWYLDNDDDGFGDPEHSQLSCAILAGSSRDGTDCDDDDAGTYPGAIEACDGVDRDCDGRIDGDAVDAPTWYVDADRDDFGVDGTGTRSCTRPSGYGPQAGDCNDSDASVHPTAHDPACDGIDQDCDGTPVDDPVQIDGRTWPSLMRALEVADGATIWVCAPGEHAVTHVQDSGSVDIRGHATEPIVIVPAGVGRMLTITNADRVTLEDIALERGGVEGDGGAASIRANRIAVRRVTLRDNTATGRGGALWLEPIGEGASVATTSLVAERNLADGHGGAIAIQAGGAPLDIALRTADNGSGGSGGALYVADPGATVLRIEASGDQALANGGSVALVGAELDLTADLDIRGSAAGGSGGGLSIEATGEIRFFAEGTIADSEAALDGGGMALSGDTVALTSPVVGFEGCSAGRNGGGLAAIAGSGGFDLRAASARSTATEKGGGIYAIAEAGDSTLWGELLDENRAAAGGAAYVIGQAETAKKAKLKLSLTNLRDNEADRGAALVVERAGVSQELLSVSMRSVEHNLGGTAVVVEGAEGGTFRARDLDGNTGGGVAVPDSVELRVTGNLGVEAGNNGPFDVRWGSEALDATSDDVVAVVCLPGSGCTTTK